MNISQYYKKTIIELRNSGSSSPELDASVLLENVIARDKTFLFSHPAEPLTNAQYSKLRRLVNRRKQGEPIAYIVGHKEFYGLDFIVNKNVLIPRPESEWLVEQARKNIEYRISNIEANHTSKIQYSRFNILDLGTGSGCIIISLAKEIEKQFDNLTIKQLNLFASDISIKTLNVAKKNTKDILAPLLSKERLGEVKIHFYHSDLFQSRLLHKKYDIIIANLPYVPYSRKLNPKSTIKYEPKIAIFAGNNGSEIIKKFLNQAKKYLANHGTILLELDPRNAIDIEKYASKLFSKVKIELKKDLAGLNRYLIIEK